MKLDELISLLALIASIIALSALSADVIKQTYVRWGLPVPRKTWLMKYKWIADHVKTIPGTDGRWKLDWATSTLVASLLGRNVIVFTILMIHGRTSSNWLITVTYVACALAAGLTVKYSRSERRKHRP